MNTNTPKGRPAKQFTWPHGQFTLNEVLGTGLSKVTLNLRAKSEVGKTLKIVGAQKSTRGRPANVYETIAA